MKCHISFTNIWRICISMNFKLHEARGYVFTFLQLYAQKYLLSHARDSRIELWEHQENITFQCYSSWEGVTLKPSQCNNFFRDRVEHNDKVWKWNSLRLPWKLRETIKKSSRTQVSKSPVKWYAFGGSLFWSIRAQLDVFCSSSLTTLHSPNCFTCLYFQLTLALIGRGSCCISVCLLSHMIPNMAGT